MSDTPTVMPRLWAVFADHSVLGVRRTKREAEAVAQLLRSVSLPDIEYRVAGPYVLLQRGQR